jgi:hypothetical protein
VAGDRDTLELYLEGMPLPPERLEGLAREVEGVFRRYLEVERVRLLTGEDERGRGWLLCAGVTLPQSKAAHRPSPPARPLPPDPG